MTPAARARSATPTRARPATSSVVSVKVGEEYVAPSAEGAAKVVAVSPPAEGRADVDMAVDLDRDTTEAGAYPVVLLSYLVACQTYESADEADLVKGYLEYIVSDEGQAAAVGERRLGAARRRPSPRRPRASSTRSPPSDRGRQLTRQRNGAAGRHPVRRTQHPPRTAQDLRTYR